MKALWQGGDLTKGEFKRTFLAVGCGTERSAQGREPAAASGEAAAEELARGGRAQDNFGSRWGPGTLRR